MARSETEPQRGEEKRERLWGNPPQAFDAPATHTGSDSKFDADMLTEDESSDSAPPTSDEASLDRDIGTCRHCNTALEKKEIPNASFYALKPQHWYNGCGGYNDLRFRRRRRKVGKETIPSKISPILNAETSELVAKRLMRIRSMVEMPLTTQEWNSRDVDDDSERRQKVEEIEALKRAIKCMSHELELISNKKCCKKECWTVDMTEVVDLIGHFGPWQACFVAYVTYRGILTGLNNLAYVFLVTDNEHWCSRPTLPDGLLANISESEWKEQFIPYDNDSRSHSQCSMYGLLQNSTTGEIVPDNTSLKSCEAWTYDEHLFGHTVTDEWNLVCENTWKRSLIQSTYMACLMLGILVIGNVSDRFGRRIVALFSTICLCASAFALTFSTSLNYFLVARVGVAVAISGLQVACFSLLAETIGPKFRIALNVCYGYGWISGLLLLPGIVWLAQDWRKLLIVQAAFAAPLLFALPWLYESPRWLISVGKQGEAVEAIRKIARFNKKQLRDVEKEVDALMKRKQNVMQGHQSNVSVFGLFKTKYLRRNTLVLVAAS
ncbi:hypothetical protein HPB52_021061 [Rhipicephalus sanguineus]|uniref:Major facilitator superfamily (MFS) profile domain-containing protein n=1 Tax=Rhipicephalus sanguineus TaxID=34632 RepID=A0A9D4PHN8_RHISA|nr:hypothetical protein HPB52_021061 [Rhipicephalus sanguineus]